MNFVTKCSSFLKKAAAVAVVSMSNAAFAVYPAVDSSAGTDYLEANVGPAMIAISVVLFSLAGIAMGIKWVKATFFG